MQSPINLALNILWRRPRSLHLLASPHTSRTNRRESEKHTERNTQPPNGLHLKTSSLARTRPNEIVQLPHILAHGIQERGRGPSGGESGAVEVG